MNSLVDFAWLIPALPLLGSLLIGLLLLSFNRTMNRLSKPVSFVLINSIGISTVLSIVFYIKHVSGEIFNLHVRLGSLDFITNFNLDNTISLILSVIGFIFFLVSLYSYYNLPRLNGYVRYLTLISFTCGIFLLCTLDSELISFILK